LELPPRDLLSSKLGSFASHLAGIALRIELASKIEAAAATHTQNYLYVTSMEASKIGLPRKVKQEAHCTPTMIKMINQVKKLRVSPVKPCILVALTSRQLIMLKTCRKTKVFQISVKWSILACPNSSS